MSGKDYSDLTKALAVALVAVSKSIASLSPEYATRLTLSLESAEQAGIPQVEHQILRMLVTSVTATADAQNSRSV